MLIVNLYGGPGTGKSTTAAQVFANLKLAGVHAELVPEPAKWAYYRGDAQDSYQFFEDQLSQLKTLACAGVEVAVVDSPLWQHYRYISVMGGFVPNSGVWLVEEIRHFESDHTSLSFFLVRDEAQPYPTEGRWESEDGAKVVDRDLLELLGLFAIPFNKVPIDRNTAASITSAVSLHLLTQEKQDG